MAEVEITTPRGVPLAGTFEPGDAGSAVLFAHGFLADRHSSMRFDILASAYRTAGHGTLQLDFSGCGASGDDVVTVAGEIEDLRSASAWLSEQGFTRQVVHAHDFGTLAALQAHLRDVTTMVLTGPITGPMSYPWEEIFSAEQLDDLDDHGYARIPDDNETSGREYSIISRQTLADYSLIDPAELLGHVEVPVLLVHGDDGATVPEMIELSREALPLLPAGSRLEVLDPPGGRDGLDALADLAVGWVADQLRTAV
ncbi:alpha/beta hydrolase family protein [Georgenia alba]|uniref:Alpha/beta hydrolase family protein n=1 Tax=Georgenia alba TaxID=2233858 RepID=A0ABW2Q9G5_9MICO